MVCILLAVPQDVCNIICSELLDAVDIGRFDCAVLQEQLRTDWIRQLQLKTMSTVMNVGLRKLKSKRYADYINWICMRDVYVTELNLNRFSDVPTFRYDRVEAIRFTREVNVSLINKCINAKSIIAENVDYNTMGEVSSQIYEQCVSLHLVMSTVYPVNPSVSHCLSLKELKLFCRMKHATTITLIKQNPTLQKFYGNGNAEVLKAILTHCKHLREFQMSIVSWDSTLYESGSVAALNDVIPVLEKEANWQRLYYFCIDHNDDQFCIKNNKYGKCLTIGKGFENFHFLFKDIEVLILNMSGDPTTLITQSKDTLNRIHAEGVCCANLSRATEVCSKLQLIQLEEFSNISDIAFNWAKIHKHINILYLKVNTINCSKDIPDLITILENSMFDKVFCNCQTVVGEYDFHKLEEYWLHIKSKQREIWLGLFCSDKLVFGFTAEHTYKCVN